MSDKPLTPEQFATRMQQIETQADGETLEGTHEEADWLMCELLRCLGYGEGIDTYHRIGKWYA